MFTECQETQNYTDICNSECTGTCIVYRGATCNQIEGCENMKTCVCQEGMADDNGTCIPVEECPCYTPDGTIMDINETKTDTSTCSI